MTYSRLADGPMAQPGRREQDGRLTSARRASQTAGFFPFSPTKDLP